MTDTPARPKLDPADLDEIKRCQEDPLYFHNKYVRYPGHKELTKEEFDMWLSGVKFLKSGRRQGISKELFLKLYPLTFDEVFSPLKK